jgi:hypothetical protein
MKQSKYKVVPVNYGISSIYSDGTIEINKKIKNPLRKVILEHEFRHGFGKYTRADFENDFTSKDSHFLEIFKLALKNKEMLINYFPLLYSYHKKRLTYNQSSIYPIIYLGLLFSVFWSSVLTLLKFSFIITFIVSVFWWILIVISFNLGLLLYTHLYVKYFS